MSSETATFWRQNVGDLSEKAFYYARTPMLLVNLAGIVADLNAACRDLLGVDVAGCRGQHYTYLVDRLRPKIEGDFLPPNGIANTHFRVSGGETRSKGMPVLDTADLNVTTTECRYHSGRFGPTGLRVSELPCIDTASGACIGSIISLEPRDMSELTAFRKSIDCRLSHEVMWGVYAASYSRSREV